MRATQKRFDLTAVMVSHDVPAVFEFSDRIAFMHQGKMALNGTVAEVSRPRIMRFTDSLQGKRIGESIAGGGSGRER